MMQRAPVIFVIVGILILAGICFGGYVFYQQKKLASISDFESCAQYYPVMTSYPGQCNTPDGRHFVQELSEEEKKKLIPPPFREELSE